MLVEERKARLRLTGRTRWRVAAPEAERARRSLLVQDNFLAAFPPAPGLRVALYSATPGEVGTDRVRARLIEAGASVYYPRVVGDRDLVFHRHGPGDGWIAGKYGIREPEVPSGDEGIRGGFDRVVVPGLAFDAQGRRLGQGFGYYDRFLLSLESKAVAIGLAFSWQIVPEVPVDPWDVSVDAIVTEDGVIRVSAARADGA